MIDISEKNRKLHEALKDSLQLPYISNKVVQAMAGYDEELDLEEIIDYWEAFVSRS